jgi:hypothetical protein
MSSEITGQQSMDPAWIAEIAREVLARLQSATRTDQTAASLDDRVITAASIERLPGTPSELFIAAGAVVTPAAQDEARRRGIAINRSAPLPQSQQPRPAKLQLSDASEPQRAEAVRNQLAVRGRPLPSARILLSDTPARDVYQHCTAGGEVAVMITSLNDVQRFAAELTPTLWVLDMKRLNIPAAANVVAKIASTESPS